MQRLLLVSVLAIAGTLAACLPTWREVLVQTFLLALGLVYWVEHPEKRWLTRVMTVAFALVILLPLLGLVVRSRGV